LKLLRVKKIASKKVVFLSALCLSVLLNSAFLSGAEEVMRGGAAPSRDDDCRFTFVFVGDSRHSTDFKQDFAGNIARMMMTRRILELRPDFLIHGGDFVREGDQELEWIQFRLEILPFRDAGIPIYAVVGNHEYRGDKTAAMRFLAETFDFEADGPKWYSFSRGGVLFVVLDSTLAYDQESEQYRWLESELEKAESGGYNFVIPLMHHPVFTAGEHNGEREKRAREILHPLFLRHRNLIKLVFSSHNHSYERMEADGITYIVSGGGGAPLYDVDLDTCLVKVFSDRIEFEMQALTADFQWAPKPSDTVTITAGVSPLMKR